MKETFFILVCLIGISANAQNLNLVIDSHFKPQSFEELAAPLIIYQQAYNRAVDQFDVYFSNAHNAIENGNYELAKTYLNRCVQLNNQFNGTICSAKDLSQWIDYCDKQIMYKEAFIRAVEQFNYFLTKAKESLDNNDYSLGKNYLIQCQQLNDSYNGEFCSKSDLSQWIVFCDHQIELQVQRIAFNSNNRVNGAQYQTDDNNISCRITKATATNKYTTLEFDYTNLYDAGGWCNITPTTYIIDKQTGKKYQLLWAEGIPKSPKKHNFQNKYETIHFKLVFPAIPAKTSIIDMIESEDSSWKFYNIKIR